MFEKKIIVAVVVLNGIFQISIATGTPHRAFDVFEQMYAESFENKEYASTIRGQFKTMRDITNAYKSGKRDVVDACINKIVEEKVCMTHMLKQYINDKERVAAIYYMHVLAHHYRLCTTKWMENISDMSVQDIEDGDKTVAITNLEIMERFLYVYEDNWELSEMFPPRAQLLFSQMGGAESESQRTQRVRNAVQPIQEAFNVNGGMNLDAMPAVKYFFDVELPNSVLPTEPPSEVSVEDVKLFLKRHKDIQLYRGDWNSRKGSRLCKTIQILMELDGFNVFNPEFLASSSA